MFREGLEPYMPLRRQNPTYALRTRSSPSNMARPGGLEPPTTRVTGGYSNQLNYGRNKLFTSQVDFTVPSAVMLLSACLTNHWQRVGLVVPCIQTHVAGYLTHEQTLLYNIVNRDKVDMSSTLILSTSEIIPCSLDRPSSSAFHP